MNTRTETDLRAILDEESTDVSTAEDFLARVPFQSRRRVGATRFVRSRRWLTPVTLAGLIVAATVVPIVLTQHRQSTNTSSGPSPTTSPAATVAPANWPQSTFTDWHLTLRYPPTWRSYQYRVVSTLTTLITYLSNQPLHDPCVTRKVPNGTEISCTQPLTHLAGDGVLISWTSLSSPARRPIAQLPGSTITVGERAAKLQITAAETACAAIGGGTQIVAAIAASGDSGSTLSLQMWACLGPRQTATNQADVLTMLATTTLPGPASSHGPPASTSRLAAPSTPRNPVPPCATGTSSYGSMTVCPGAGPVGTVVSVSGTGCQSYSSGFRDFPVVFLGPSAYLGSSGGGVDISLPVTSTGKFYGTFQIPSSYPSGGNSNQELPTNPGTEYGFSTLTRSCYVRFSVTNRPTG
jgi:hypothetical protein